MKDMNKIINFILISVTGLVVIIFVFGFLKKSEIIQRTDQSSISDLNPDDQTNKYIKELQIKLKQEERDSAAALKLAQKMKPLEKPKDDDWRQVPLDQQISPEEVVAIERTTATATFGGTSITKDNAAEFIATARRNGYHVILSPSYEVISITPIMNTHKKSEIFDTNPAD